MAFLPKLDGLKLVAIKLRESYEDKRTKKCIRL